jgi:hypothetical protein
MSRGSTTPLSCGIGPCGWLLRWPPGHPTEWSAMKVVAQKLGIGSTEILRKLGASLAGRHRCPGG